MANNQVKSQDCVKAQSSRGVLIAKLHYKLWGFTMIFLCDASSRRNKGYLNVCTVRAQNIDSFHLKKFMSSTSVSIFQTKELTLIAWGVH